MKITAKGVLLVTMSILLVLILSVYGCSCSKEEQERPKPQGEADQGAGEQRADEEEGVEASGDESHRVDECQKHWYYVAPGESASVTFETEIDANAAKIANSEEPTVQKGEMESEGYSVSYSSRSVDTVKVSVPLWTVYDSNLAEKDRKWLTYTTTAGIGIRWNRAGEGVIDKVPGIKGELAVGRLSSEEFNKALGGRSTLDVLSPANVSYSVSPSKQSKDTEFHILSVTLSIGVPSDTTRILKKKSATVMWKGSGITFNASYNNINKKYAITGPAKSSSCMK